MGAEMLNFSAFVSKRNTFNYCFDLNGESKTFDVKQRPIFFFEIAIKLFAIRWNN